MAAGPVARHKAILVWQLEPPEGSTIVGTLESWEGPVPRVFRGRMQKLLQGAIDSGLSHLKAEAERRAAQAPAS